MASADGLLGPAVQERESPVYAQTALTWPVVLDQDGHELLPDGRPEFLECRSMHPRELLVLPPYTIDLLPNPADCGVHWRNMDEGAMGFDGLRTNADEPILIHLRFAGIQKDSDFSFELIFEVLSGPSVARFGSVGGGRTGKAKVSLREELRIPLRRTAF
ncbi:hypothetical protein VTK56DRAFT_3619 [Thermocarpiscus australiensis]